MSGEPKQDSEGLVPDWAVEKAIHLHNIAGGRFLNYTDMREAFARYIAAHEPEPVDPLREAVQAAAETAMVGKASFWDGLDALTAELRARGVTMEKNNG